METALKWISYHNSHLLLTSNLILCHFLGTLYGIEIKLHKYDTGNEETGFKKIIANKDKVVFECLLDYSDDPQAKFVYFQILKQNDPEYKHLCLLDLRTQCRKYESLPVCSCALMAENVVHINVSVNASISLNGALLRGTVIRSNDNKKFVSEEQEFPLIYDTKESEPIMIIALTITFGILILCLMRLLLREHIKKASIFLGLPYYYIDLIFKMKNKQWQN